MKYLIALIGISMVWSVDNPVSTGVVNLVPNASFEQGECPTSTSTVRKLEYWRSANGGTPDHYHKCSLAAGVPDNRKGEQEAADSNAYAGIGFFVGTGSREYLQCRLTQVLEKGKRYKYTVQVSLADKSTHYLNTMDVALTESRIHRRSKRTIKCDSANIIRCDSDSGFADAKAWVTVAGEYQAQGGEKYLTLGWFRINESPVLVGGKSNAALGPTFAYYYFDNMKLIESK